MQHYGLPTRLLDWTRSPLVALYFALEGYTCEHGEPADACIWVLKPHALNADQGFQPLTPPIDANMCHEMLQPAFYHRFPEKNKVIAAMASETDIRMFVQQGCFTIHSSSPPLEALPNCHAFLTKLVIPSHCIERLALEVDVCGFRRGDMFPDLQNLADELKRTYRPKS
jgi:hypothetical protein